MSDRDQRVPDLLLERYRLGELSGEQEQELKQRLLTDPEGAAQLRQLQESDLEIERQHPPEWLAGQVRARLQARTSARRRSRGVRRWSWLAALASAAAVLIVVWRLAPPLRSPDAPASAARLEAAAGDRVKGLRPSLVLYRQTAVGSEPLQDGARARAGQVVRLAYRAAGRGYGTVFSIDGRGVVTRHLPEAGSRAMPLRSGETVLLDHAYELDDAPRFERFYLVASEAPFDLDPVLGAARRAAASAHGHDPASLPLPKGFEQSTFSLEKEESR